MTSKYHYTYRITNIIINMHYYGVRSSKVEPKSDLGVIYFSSSSNKEFLQDQKDNPQNYKYKIIKISNTREKAINLEIKLHSKLNVGVNENFYNKSKQTSSGWDNSYLDFNKIARKEKENGGYILRGKTASLTWENKSIEEKKIHSKKMIDAFSNIDTTARAYKSAETKRENGLLPIGSKNGRALKIDIFNENDEIIYECYGNFGQVCADNNLPQRALYKSYKNDGQPIYTSLNSSNPNTKRIADKGHDVYRGWYAKLRSNELHVR